MNTTDPVLSAAQCLDLALVTSSDGEVLSGLWYVGVILSILASVASNLGVNIQKYSLTKEMARAEEKGVPERGYVRQSFWVFGLFFVIFGAIGDFAALGFAAQSLATPVGGFTIVANIFFGNLFHGETLSKRDLAATAFILLGLVLVAVSGDKTEKEYTLDCLLELYKRMVFIFYIIILCLICGGLLIVTRYLGELRDTAYEVAQEYTETSLQYHKAKKTKYERYSQIHVFFPTALSGIIGSQSVLFAKCTIEIFKSAFIVDVSEQQELSNNTDNSFLRFETYIIIVCMLLTIFNQLHWLSHSLRYFDAVLVVPIFQCFFITGGVIGGAVFFDEFRGFDVPRLAQFIGGMVITIFGVALLSFREKPTEESLDMGGGSSFEDQTVKLNRSSVAQLAISDFLSSFRDEAASLNLSIKRTGTRRNTDGGLTPGGGKLSDIWRSMRATSHQPKKAEPGTNSPDTAFRLSAKSSFGIGGGSDSPKPISGSVEAITPQSELRTATPKTSSPNKERTSEPFRLSARSTISFIRETTSRLSPTTKKRTAKNPQYHSDTTSHRGLDAEVVEF